VFNDDDKQKEGKRDEERRGERGERQYLLR